MNHRPVLVFRTSVHTPDDVARLRPALDRILASEGRWNFDLEDIDHVLRVETASTSPRAVMALMHVHGHECAELE